MAVLAYHYVSSYVPEERLAGTWLEPVTSATRYGYLGVNLFFLISGFVILWSALGRNATDFAISRVSRLYPSFWASMLVTGLIVYVFGSAVDRATLLNVPTLAANATMMPTVLQSPRLDDVYWTLEIELRFYALIFLLLLLRSSQRIELFVHAWISVALVGQFVDLPWLIGYVTLGSYGPFFAGGCLLYLVWARGWNWPRAAFLFIAAALCMLYAVEQRASFLTTDAVSAIIAPLIVAASFMALWWAGGGAGTGRFALWQTRFGALTYPLYLTHAAIGAVMIDMLLPVLSPGWVLALVTLVALVFAQVMVLTIDQPARRPMAAACRRVLQWLRLRTSSHMGESASP